MSTFWLIIAALIFTALVAYLVVNYIPQKFHWIVSLVLLTTIAFLSYKIYFSINKPIAFNIEKKERYASVINKLKIIRDAQVVYKKAIGNYSSDGQALISFIDTAKIPITKVSIISSDSLSINSDEQETPQRVVDTIGYTQVKESFKNRDYKNMLKNPYALEEFKIETDSIFKYNAMSVPVFEVKVAKSAILNGLDKKLIEQEKKAIGGKEIPGNYVKLGSLTQLSDRGNWPVFYDR